MSLPAEIQDYLDMIRGGEHPMCKEQRMMADLVERELASDDVVIDENRLCEYMSYQKYFPYRLFPWEKFVFALHNCVFHRDGTPRWKDLFVLCGRGAGKNGYLAFQAFCQLTKTNGIRNYDVDICATSEDQAETSFDDLLEVMEDPKNYVKMKKHFRWNRERIENLDTHSTLRYRTNNAKGKDGLRSGAVYFDEVHAYESWDNINVFTTGLGKKPCPRRTYVTTNGSVRDGVLDRMIEKSEKILAGEIPDDGFLPFICKLDSADEVTDERNWYKANPSLQYFPNLLTEIRDEYSEYCQMPQVNTSFMTKRMNIPQGRTDIEVTSWENLLTASRERPELVGCPCVCGIDYAKTTDFVAAVLLFYRDDTYYVIHHSWYCTHSSDRGVIRLPLDEMQKRGLLTIVDDLEIPAAAVADWILIQRQMYNIEMVCIDSYRLAMMSGALKDIGYTYKGHTLRTVRPSDIAKVQPLINSVFATGRIAWGDDPMMRWYTNNAKLVPAPNNNWSFGKIEPHSRKTDGFMALVAAMTQEEKLHEREAGVMLEPFVFK